MWIRKKPCSFAIHTSMSKVKYLGGHPSVLLCDYRVVFKPKSGVFSCNLLCSLWRAEAVI